MEKEEVEKDKVKVCPCFPEHCEDSSHWNKYGYCWCSPTIEEIEDSILVIHQDEN